MVLDLMLEALGDAKGLAWALDWPGAARMGCIALRPGGGVVLPGTRDPGYDQRQVEGVFDDYVPYY